MKITPLLIAFFFLAFLCIGIFFTGQNLSLGLSLLAFLAIPSGLYIYSSFFNPPSPLEEKDLQERLLKFFLNLGQTWYILLGLVAMAYLMLVSSVGINLMDYILETLWEKTSLNLLLGFVLILLKFIFNLLALTTLALVNWMTPQKKDPALTKDEDSWEQRLKTNIYRYEAAIVFLLMSMFIDRIHFIDNPTDIQFTPINVLVNGLFLILLVYTERLFNKNHDGVSLYKHRLNAGLAALVALLLFIVVTTIIVHHNNIDAYGILLRILLEISVLSFGFFFWVLTFKPPTKDTSIVAVSKPVDDLVRKTFIDDRKNDHWRIGILLGLYVIAIAFILTPNLMSIPPLAVFLFGMAFIIFNLDALHFSFIEKKFLSFKGTTAQLLVLLVSFLIVFLIFFHVTPSRIPLVSGKVTVGDRPSFDTAFIKWVKDRENDIMKGDSIYPVYIISGQGGGSRAGYWMCRALLILDSLPNLNFREHCFALSTVSGSSIGAAATLAFWDRFPEKASIDSTFYDYYPRRVFNGNFITGNLSGLFFAETFQKVNLFGLIPIMDRNERLRREELMCVGRALKELETVPKILLWPWSNPQEFEKENLLQEHFLSIYPKRPNLPYFFPNTCHVQSGKRAVYSPLKLSSNFKDSIFIQSHDCIDNTSSSTHGPSLVAAANTSELFPLFSLAASNCKGDTYVDGGYYENYGLTTALDLYEYCSKLIKKRQNAQDTLFSKLRVILISINNAPEYPTDDILHPVNQWAAPAAAVFNTRFGGQSEYMRTVAKRQAGGQYFEINNRPENDVPLTRVLTSKNMCQMDSVIKDSIESMLLNDLFRKELKKDD